MLPTYQEMDAYVALLFKDLWTFLPLVSSPPGRFTIHTMDVSSSRHGRFTPLTGNNNKKFSKADRPAR